MPHLPGLAALLVLAVSVAACSKTESSPNGGPEPTLAAASTTGKTAAQPAATKDFAATLKAYEAARAALARDDLTGAKAAAKALAAATDDKVLATAATTLSGADSLKSARPAFGEVSKHLVSALDEHPEAKQGLHLFECPMASGFKRWVQPTKELNNPYMGTAMPTCGSSVDWAG